MKCNSFKSQSQKGFTLVEIMVVVVILALLSTAAVVGFGGAKESIQIEETAKVIQDRLKQLELEAINGEYESHLIHFQPELLVVDSRPSSNSLTLSYLGFGLEGCEENETTLSFETDQQVNLILQDQKGQNLELLPFKTDTTYCAPMMDDQSLSWQYQLQSNGAFSNRIRFLHFNLDRDGSHAPVQISSGTDLQLKIEAPYGKKTFYKLGEIYQGDASLTLTHPAGIEEVVELNP